MRFKKRNPLWFFLAALVAAVIFHSFGWLRPLENFFLFLAKPLAGSLYSFGASYSASNENGEAAIDWNARAAELSRQVADLTAANSRCAEINAENQKLSRLLDFSGANDFKHLAVGVIARQEAAGENRDLIINRGRQDGVEVGFGVVDEAGAIVGKVREVKESTALVCLVTSPGCQLAAAFQNETGTQGVTNGDLGLTVRMDYIPQLEKVALGDIVMTSGLDGRLPRGLVIGRVSAVRNTANDVWQDVTIEPTANINNLTVAAVIIP